MIRGNSSNNKCGLKGVGKKSGPCKELRSELWKRTIVNILSLQGKENQFV